MVLDNMKKQTGESKESKQVSSVPLRPGGALSTVNWALSLQSLIVKYSTDLPTVDLLKAFS